jgi:hypothetical protein
VVRGCSEPQPIDNLRGIGGTALMRHALASKTCFAIALLVRRRSVALESRGLQNNLGLLHGAAGGPRCHHWSAKNLDDLPEWDWYDISAHLKCTRCGSVGWVDTRPNWGEVINFNKGIS